MNSPNPSWQNTNAAVSEEPPRSLLLFAVTLAAGTFEFITIVSSRQQFRQWLSDFDLPLTKISALALGPVLPWVVGLLILATLLLDRLPIPSIVKNVTHAVSLGFFAVVLLVYLAGVGTPLLQLLKGLS